MYVCYVEMFTKSLATVVWSGTFRWLWLAKLMTQWQAWHTGRLVDREMPGKIGVRWRITGS